MKNKLASLLFCFFTSTYVFAAAQPVKQIHLCEATVAGKTYPCSLGGAGTSNIKQEGDGTTPTGTFLLRKIFYRPDRINKNDIKSSLPMQALQLNDGWCDDTNCKEYNSYIKLPFSGSHENLWRDDNVYDVIVVIGYNDNPVIKQKGSAIFLHVARDGYPPTAGCIAFSKNDLLEILGKVSAKTTITISAQNKVSFN